MQELIRIESTPALLSVNFKELKSALAKELAKYDVVVTADTMADAKKLATELNKTAGEIDKRRKEEVAKVSEPIRAFDDSMKELVGMCKDGREKLLSQVKRFEDETRETCRALLNTERQEMWAHHKVAEEYQRAEFDDLILVSNVTASGNLTAKARNELESRVVADKADQDRTERRLLELRAKSLEAGLVAALTRDHVTPFLACDDEVYEREVDRIIAAELQRQAQAEERMRERIRAEEERKARAEVEERVRHEARKAEMARQEQDSARRATIQRETHEPVEQEKVSPGRVAITVLAEFRTEVPEGLSDEKIEQALRRQIEGAGIKSLSKVEIIRHMQDAA